MKEIWKDINGYEGLYKVSNFGRVWSEYKQDFKKQTKNKGRDNYFRIMLSKNNIPKVYKIHHLVWDHFGNKPRDGHKLQVDHIDNNRYNNRIDNLQLLNNRQNTSKDIKNKTSQYTGVYWRKERNKWQAQKQIDGKTYYLGSFDSEIEAFNAYQNFS